MSELDALYQQLILDHAKTPHGRGFAGPLAPGDAESRQYNPVCGDEVTVRVLRDAAGLVTGLTWEGHGCSISQASASMLAVLVAEDAPLDAAALEARIERFREVLRSRGELALDEAEFGDAAALSGVSRYVQRVKCAMLAWVGAEAALKR